MRIERVNENTVKLFITYVDIEKRGFARDEIWYNRERGEQLFWQMMDEAYERENISFDGPLWIQVQAFEKGLEVTVTIAKNLPDQGGDDTDLQSLLRSAVEDTADKQDVFDQLEEDESEERWAPVVMETDDIESLISLSKRDEKLFEHLQLKLFHYAGKYYLYVDFTNDLGVEYEENVLGVMAEYLSFGEQTLAMLEEYGKVILEGDVMGQLRRYF